VRLDEATEILAAERHGHPSTRRADTRDRYAVLPCHHLCSAPSCRPALGRLHQRGHARPLRQRCLAALGKSPSRRRWCFDGDCRLASVPPHSTVTQSNFVKLMCIVWIQDWLRSPHALCRRGVPPVRRDSPSGPRIRRDQPLRDHSRWPAFPPRPRVLPRHVLPWNLLADRPSQGGSARMICWPLPGSWRRPSCSCSGPWF